MIYGVYVNVIDIDLWKSRKLANDIKSGKLNARDVELKSISRAKKILNDAGEKRLANYLMEAYAKSFSSRFEKEAIEFKKKEEELIEIVKRMVKIWINKSKDIVLPFLLRRFYSAKDNLDSVIHAINDVVFNSGNVPRHKFCDLIDEINSVLPAVKDELAVRHVEAENVTKADVPNRSSNTAVDMAERLIARIVHAKNLIIEYERHIQNKK